MSVESAFDEITRKLEGDNSLIEIAYILNRIWSLLNMINHDNEHFNIIVYELAEYLEIIGEQIERDVEGYDPSIL